MFQAYLQKHLSELQSVLVAVVVPTKLLLALGKGEDTDFFMTTAPHLFWRCQECLEGA